MTLKRGEEEEAVTCAMPLPIRPLPRMPMWEMGRRVESRRRLKVVDIMVAGVVGQQGRQAAQHMAWPSTGLPCSKRAKAAELRRTTQVLCRCAAKPVSVSTQQYMYCADQRNSDSSCVHLC